MKAHIKEQMSPVYGLELRRGMGDVLERDDAESFYSWADEAYGEGRHEDALRLYSRALEARPKFAEALHSRGVVFFLLGDTQKAIHDYTEVIRSSFYDKHVTYKSRGQCFTELHKYQQAVRDFTRALELRPDYDGAYHERGIALMALKEYRKAAADFSVAIEFGTDDRHVTYLCRSKCYRALGLDSLADEDETFGQNILRYRNEDNLADTQETEKTSSLSEKEQQEFRERVYKYVGKYAVANDTHSAYYLGVTLLLTVLLNWVMHPSIFLWVPAALVRMRMFMLFHDCCHGSLWTSSKVNQWVGYVLGFLVYTPFTEWKQGHQFHHRHSNNLDYPQDGAQTAPWTAEEYMISTRRQRALYKFTFGSWTGLTVVPSFSLIVMQRIASTWQENCGVFVWVFLNWLHGWSWMFYELATMGLTATFGFSLFHIQHTFEGSYKARSDTWSAFENGMRGCSFLQVPMILKPFTFGIEYHHIHHLNTKVPSYRLQECQRNSGDLFADVPHIYFTDYIRSLRYSLYDEFSRKYSSVYEYGGYFSASLHRTGKVAASAAAQQEIRPVFPSIATTPMSS